jgi:hypothetical protein
MPAKDFELSKRFYEALGFEKVLDSEVAIFNAGSGGFILQRPRRNLRLCSPGAFVSPMCVDPSGVLWHIAQRRKDARQDQ